MAAASMKRAGKGERHGGARDGDGVIFERLAHHLEHVAGKLRQLVEEEKPVVRERDFAGAGNDAAADEARRRRWCGAASERAAA
jgi:hypothetical protein